MHFYITFYLFLHISKRFQQSILRVPKISLPYKRMCLVVWSKRGTILSPFWCNWPKTITYLNLAFATEKRVRFQLIILMPFIHSYISKAVGPIRQFKRRNAVCKPLIFTVNYLHSQSCRCCQTNFEGTTFTCLYVKCCLKKALRKTTTTYDFVERKINRRNSQQQ